ncbi:hypothetical protein BZG36_01236 [Bifiguratus adelaidae]|uniref:BED-type domain-containing protein n=1 Tax=Bifiguratus adelaidae TaxID=1938954 RepID=A0A261Y5T8_9FUNG|nr:hypothetical protein BZG36_01236 [Bifiguratus adelaidae]
MPRPTSDIWAFYTVIPSHTKVPKTRCTFCGHEQAAGVTRLAMHLLDKCPHAPEDVKEEVRQSTKQYKKGFEHIDIEALDDEQGTTQSPFSRSGKAPDTRPRKRRAVSVNRLYMDPAEQTHLDRSLARALFAANIDIDAIEHPLIASFLQQLRPGYQSPRARRLRQFLFKSEHWDLFEDMERPRRRMVSSPDVDPPYAWHTLGTPTRSQTQRQTPSSQQQSPTANRVQQQPLAPSLNDNTYSMNLATGNLGNAQRQAPYGDSNIALEM